MKAIICDLDGTLADCRHRLHHVLPGGPMNWTAFHDELHLDPVIEPVKKIVNSAWTGDNVILTTGRPESHRELTEQWLRDNDVNYDELYMRPTGDTRPDAVVKREMLDAILADGYEPFIAIDDRPSVVQVWRDAGIVCLQAAPGLPAIPSTAVLTLMVGPSGSGKTTWLREHGVLTNFGDGSYIRSSHIVSSDDIRQDLLGDFRDQSANARVFAAVHSIALARLRAGLPVTIDATHLHRKDRMTAAQLVPATNRVRYVVIDRPLDQKLATGGWRLDVKNSRGVDLIHRHDETFRAQLKDILAGDNLPNVEVHDLRYTQLRVN